MYVLHVKVVVQDGGHAHYEGWKINEGHSQRRAKGFIKRSLLRSKENPNTYFYQTFWESLEDCLAYSQGDEFQRLSAAYQVTKVFAQPMEREECDVIFDEVAEPEAAVAH